MPDFGADPEIAATQRHLALAEQNLQHKWVVDQNPAKPPPVDYFVPNFGRDQEIMDNFENLSATEKAMNHKWDWKLLPAKAFNKDLGVPPFQQEIASFEFKESNLDGDMQTSLQNTKKAESNLDVKWNPYEEEE